MSTGNLPGIALGEINKPDKQMIDAEASATLLDEKKVKMAVPKRKLTKLVKVAALICVITLILIIITALATGRRVTEVMSFVKPESSVKNAILSESDKTLRFIEDGQKQAYLIINFPHIVTKSEYMPSSPCRNSYSDTESESQNVELRETLDSSSQMCFQFADEIKVAIYETDVDGFPCHHVQWYSTNKNAEIENCLNIDNSRWYGGGGLSIHRWPLNRAKIPLQPHLAQKHTTEKLRPSNGNQQEQAFFDSFTEPYFVSAHGTALLFEPYLPLFISVKDEKMCFRSAFRKPYSSAGNDHVLLKYMVCKDRSAKAVHRELLERSKVNHPRQSPSTEILRKPIWSTQGLDLVSISETEVLDFLIKKIKINKLPFHQLFIDGNYSRFTGSLFFNEKKFPHSHQLIMELSEDTDPSTEKLLVGTEVYPYAPPSKELSKFAMQYNVSSASDIRNVSYLDLTNEEAVLWFNSQLQEVRKQIHLEGFRFSGGLALDVMNNLPLSSLLTKNPLLHPNMFTNKYAEIASEFGNRSLIRGGYRSQQYTFIADAGPMIQSAEHNKGLKSIIPTVLTYGIMGYPFVLAGPVGGVTSQIDGKTGLLRAPARELFIRWLQIAIYLPALELSSGPWVYGEEVTNYTRTMLKFRHDDLWPKYFSGAVKEAVEVGTPIVRPLWWISPDDKTAQWIDCEFFLSNSLLVAPVLYPDDTGRDIYLPEGSWWKDQLRGETYEGGQWLRRYNVGLYEVATFVRVAAPKSQQ